MAQRVIKLKEVKLITGLSASSVYRGASSGTFPTPIKLGERSSGWLKSEVDQWLQDRIEASRNNGEAL